MAKHSAGLLMYRRRSGRLEVFLVHPGGPFWAKKDLGAWSIPKGRYGDDEQPLDAAKREFLEETGFLCEGALIPLGARSQPAGTVLEAWGIEGDCDPAKLRSNTFSMEWPPRSGKSAEFPEVDRGDWFAIDAARQRILKGQIPFLDALLEKLG